MITLIIHGHSLFAINLIPPLLSNVFSPMLKLSFILWLNVCNVTMAANFLTLTFALSSILTALFFVYLALILLSRMAKQSTCYVPPTTLYEHFSFRPTSSHLLGQSTSHRKSLNQHSPLTSHRSRHASLSSLLPTPDLHAPSNLRLSLLPESLCHHSQQTPPTINPVCFHRISTGAQRL
jgi:hypothetical protein